MKKALVVGVNEFETQKDLRGCKTDADEMEALLNQKYHFDDIVKITEPDLSRGQLVQHIKDLLAPEPQEEDGVRVFFMASHGGRTFDQPDGDELDKVDENICLFDYSWDDDTSYILDDDFGTILNRAHQEAPQLRFYVVLDLCHSGTGTRDVEADKDWDQIETYLAGSPDFDFSETSEICDFIDWDIDDPRMPLISVARQAFDPPDLEERLSPATSSSTFGMPAGGIEPTSHLLLSGCAASQTCKDAPLDGGYHGVFTYAFTRLAHQNSEFTWAQIHQDVSETIAEGYRQDPQLEGPLSLKMRPIFT